MFRRRAAIIVVLFVASTTNAFADAVPSPPKDCPRGAIGQTSHTGTWCDPRECRSDDDCKSLWGGGGYVAGRCETTSLCVRRKMIPVHRRVVQPDGGVSMHERTYAVSACGRDSTCEEADAKCETARRCVVATATAPSPDAGGPPRGCGCGKTTAGPKANALVGLLVGVWLLRRRASRRS